MAAIALGSRLAGATPRSPSAVMSCRASSGLPAVVRAHSAQIASPMSSPRRSRTNRATPAGLSGTGRTAALGSRSASRVSASGAAAVSPVRIATIRQAGSSSILASR